MENNDLKGFADMMLKGVTGMASFLEKDIETMKSKLTEKEAREFAENAANFDIDKKLRDMKNELKNLNV